MLSSFVVPGGAFACGWTGYAPLYSTAPADRRDLLQPGRPVGGCVVDHDRPQLPRHDHHDARAGNDLLADAAPRLGELHDLAARRDRDAVHRRLAVLLDVRPRDAHVVLRPGRRRLPARVPAHLLVLLAPGRLHHDAARLRDHERGHIRLQPQADLRLPADGALADGDRRARLLGLGAPHVRQRHVVVAARADDDHDAADRRPDRDQDLQLARDDLGREAPLAARRCCSRSASSRCS